MEKQLIKFNGETYILHISRYQSNNQTSLQLLTEEGLPFMTITKNIEHVILEEDEVIIKDYSENEGILQALIKENVIAKPHETINSGYVKLHICQLIN